MHEAALDRLVKADSESGMIVLTEGAIRDEAAALLSSVDDMDPSEQTLVAAATQRYEVASQLVHHLALRNAMVGMDRAIDAGGISVDVSAVVDKVKERYVEAVAAAAYAKLQAQG